MTELIVFAAVGAACLAGYLFWRRAKAKTRKPSKDDIYPMW